MPRGYFPIRYEQFAEAMRDKGFIEVNMVATGTWEHVWERPVNCRLSQGRYRIRILSSISHNTGVTREAATDVIHVQLLDTQRKSPDRPILDRRVLRTENALSTLVERAREMYGYVSQHPEHHCTCGHLMVRRGKPDRQFLGCTAFPECRETRRPQEPER